eukprot:2938576-Karenia_brevis.AAC.1
MSAFQLGQHVSCVIVVRNPTIPAMHASHLFFDDRCFGCTLHVVLRQLVIQSIEQTLTVGYHCTQWVFYFRPLCPQHCGPTTNRSPVFWTLRQDVDITNTWY